MKTINEILREKYPGKLNYSMSMVVYAQNAYLRQLLTKTINRSPKIELPKSKSKHKKLYIIKNENSKLNGKRVMSTFIKNPNGFVRIWFNGKSDHIHFSFLKRIYK